jgi:hypothetical protein
MMAARLERDVGGAAACRLAGHGERFGFGMRATAQPGAATSGNLAIAVDDDAADRRVGPGGAKGC